MAARPTVAPAAVAGLPRAQSRGQGRLRSIDALRGCAALAVVADHAFKHGGYAAIAAPWFLALRSVANHGVLGVPLFFVISGFCIHLPWARRAAAGEPARVNVREFWLRRLHRLYPPYFVMLCLSIAAVVTASALGLPIATVDRYPEPRATWIAADFLLHATMLHGFSPTFDQMAGNPPFWTLAREEYLYLMYFAVLTWRGRRGMLFALATVFAIGIVVPWLASVVIPSLPVGPAWQDRLWHPVHMETSAIALWIQWCLGMAAVEGCYGVIRLPVWCRRIAVAVAWGAAALFAERHGWTSLTPVLWGLAFFTLLNRLVALEQSGRWPSAGPAGWLSAVGLVSYSIYLVHSPLIGLLNQAERSVLGRSSPLLVMPGYHLATWALFVLAAVLAGWAFFQVVERRFLNGPRGIARPS